MRTAEAINFFGTQVALAAALEITQPSIAEWGEFPPDIRQLQIQKLTRWKLRAETSCLEPKKRNQAKAR